MPNENNKAWLFFCILYLLLIKGGKYDWLLPLLTGSVESSEPQPIPHFLVTHDRDWLSVSPYSIRFWVSRVLLLYGNHLCFNICLVKRASGSLYGLRFQFMGKACFIYKMKVNEGDILKCCRLLLSVLLNRTSNIWSHLGDPETSSILWLLLKMSSCCSMYEASSRNSAQFMNSVDWAAMFQSSHCVMASYA